MKPAHHIRNAHREVMAVAQAQGRPHTHLRRRLLTIFFATAFIALVRPEPQSGRDSGSE